MSTYTQELAKRIRQQNEIQDIYNKRQSEAQVSYDKALGVIQNGGDVYSLDDSARNMYRNIESEYARAQREEQERLKSERGKMSGIERFGHTIGDFLGRTAGGVMKFGENVVDYFGTMFGADEDWVKRDYTQELYLDKLLEGTKGSYLYDGKFGNMLQDVAFGTGNVLPSLALNLVPGIGSAASFGSFMANAAGGSTESALQNGATRNEALLYGTLSGISEGAIEKISGGIGGLGKGIVQSIGKGAGKSAVAKGIKGTVKKYAGRMVGEGLEEVASDVIDPLLKATYTGNVDYSDVSLGSLANTFGVGALTSGVMLGGQAAINNSTAANRVRTRLGELNEIKAGLDERYYKGKLTEGQYRQGLEDINWLAERAVKTLDGISEKRADKVVEKLGNAPKIGVNGVLTDVKGMRTASGLGRLKDAGIVRNDGGFSVSKANADGYNYKAMTPSLANRADTLAFKPTAEKLTPEQEGLIKEYGKLNNGKAGIVFTDEIGAAAAGGRTASANGAYSDGVIYISRSAAQPIREVMKHEFTHSLEGSKAYGEYAEFVLNEIRKSPTLQKEYGSLIAEIADATQQYEGIAGDKTDILTEVVARYTERVFSDPKAINRLARANKGMARKALGMITDRLTALGNGKDNAETRRFLLRAESLYRKAIAAKPTKADVISTDTEDDNITAADIDVESSISNADLTNITENPAKIVTKHKNIKIVNKINGNKIAFDIGKPFVEQVDDVINNAHDPNLDLFVCKTPNALINIGFKNKPVLMRNSKIKEILEKHKEMNVEIIKGIPKAIETPLLILKSKTNPNESVVVITEINTDKGSLIIPIYMNIEGKYFDIELNKVVSGEQNFAASAYGRNLKTLLEYAVNNNEILYADKNKMKKVSQLFSAHGLQLPAPLNMTNFNNSITDSDANVNNPAENSLKNSYNVIENDRDNIDKTNANAGNDVKYSLKDSIESRGNQEIALSAEETETLNKAIKAINNENIARGHITDIVKSLRIEIDGKIYRAVYNDKYFAVSVPMLEKALRGIKNNSTAELGALSKHLLNVVELYDENAYRYINSHSQAELNKINKLLSNAKRNKIRISGSLIAANDTHIVNEYCSTSGAVTLTSLVNQLKAHGVIIKGRTLIDKLHNLDSLYETISNSKIGLKINDIAPNKIESQQRVIANRIIKRIDKSGAMTAIVNAARNIEKAKAKAAEEKAKADARVARAKEIEKQSYEREKMEAPIIQIKDICSRFKEYAVRNYRSGSILGMPDMDGIIKAFDKITWVRGFRSNKAVHEALTRLQSFIKANRNAEDVILGFSQEIIDKIDNLVEVTRLKPYDAKPDKIKTKKEVDDLLKIVKAVDYLFKNHHAIVLDGETQDASGLTSTAIEELDYACNYNKGMNVAVMKESQATADPRTIYTLVSGAFDDNNVIMRLFDDLTESETAAKLTAIELLEPVENYFNDNKRYKKDIYDKKITLKGASLELGQAIMIYMQSKQDGVIDRLALTGAYGKDSKGKAIDIKSITATDIEAIEKQFTATDFELIKLIEDTFRQAGEIKYEADVNLNGYSDINPGKYYVPLVVEGSNLVKSYTSAAQWSDEFNERNYGFNNHRNRLANKQLKLVNIFDELYRHCRDLGVYAGLTQAFRNFDQLMNYNLNLGNPDSKTVITLKSHINKNVWSGFDKYQLDYFADIRGDNRQNKSEIIDWLRNNWIVARLGLNIKSWISQFSGLAMGGIHLKFKHLAKGIAKPMSKERFLEYGGYGKVRTHDRAAVRATGFEGKMGKIKGYATRPIQLADNLMMRQFMSGCEAQIEERLGHKIETRKEMDLVCKLFELTVRETQSSDMMSEKSAWQRHQNDTLRTLTTFKSDSIKMLSNIKMNTYKIIAAKKYLKANPDSERGKLALKKAYKQLRRSITCMTISNAIYVGIAMLFSFLLRKRDEDGNKRDINDYLKAFGTGMLESIAGMYPLVGDIFNKVTSGYDIEQFGYSMVNDLVDGTTGVFMLIENAINGEEVTRTDAMRALRNAFYSATELFGVPSKNLFKYVKMIGGVIDEGALYRHNSVFYPAKKSELDAAIKEKNDRLAESIFMVMLTERGYDDLSETSMRKLLELYKANYEIIPSNVPNKLTWKNEYGDEQEKELKAGDKAMYRVNNAAAAKDVEKLLKSSNYTALTQKEKADAIKKVYSYYNSLSKSKVSGEDVIDTQRVLASLLSVEEMAVLTAKNANLTADKHYNGKTIPGSKKRKLLKILNTFGLTFAEKELVRILLGYSPSSPSAVKRYLNTSKLSKEEKEFILDKME